MVRFTQSSEGSIANSACCVFSMRRRSIVGTRAMKDAPALALNSRRISQRLYCYRKG
jgi:hypothetical protein